MKWRDTTRGGFPTRIYAEDGIGTRPIHGAIKTIYGWVSYAWYANGRFSNLGEDHPYDLIPEATGGRVMSANKQNRAWVVSDRHRAVIEVTFKKRTPKLIMGISESRVVYGKHYVCLGYSQLDFQNVRFSLNEALDEVARRLQLEIDGAEQRLSNLKKEMADLGKARTAAQKDSLNG